MIKATKYIVVFLMLLFVQKNSYAQYTGGSADGFAIDQYTLTTCSTPSQFFAYMGGSGDGFSVNQYTLTTCGTPSQFYAFSGGTGDGFSVNQFTLTTCGTPPQFYAYAGGIGDGFSRNTFTLTSCGTPTQFYAYMGGNGDGFARDTLTKCPTAPPVANFSATPTSVCVGATVNFTDLSTNSPAAWSWIFQGGTPTTFTVQNPVVVYNTLGTFSVSLTATNGMGSNTYTVTNYITVTAIPIANAGSDVAICNGSSTNLSASGGGTYTWTPATGLSATNISNPVANPTVTTTYSVTVSTGGCTATDAMTVTVNAIPIANAGPSKVICKGASVTLTASGGGTYSWTPSIALTSTTISNPGASPTVTTTYSVTVTTAGCSATDSLIVTVNPVPTATISAGGPTTFCTPGNVVLTSSAGTSYLWSNSATTQTISVTTSGNYNVTVTNTFTCSATSASTSVTVHPLGTANITPSGATTFCQGGSVNLTANSGAAYSWTGGATTQAINVTTSGTYTVSVDDIFGCSVPSPTATINVTVNPNPATPTITVVGTNSLCIGDTAILKSSPGTSYLWSTGATTDSIITTLAGSYSVTVYNGFGCSTISAGTGVNVNAPLVDFTADTLLVFIPSAVVTFTANVNGNPPYTYLWNFGDGNTSTAIAPTHTYITIGYDTVSLKLTDITGCSQTKTKLSYIEVEQLFPSTAMNTFTTLNLTGVSFIDAKTGIISLTDGNCILSVDSGNNWSPLPTGNTFPLRNACVIPGNWFVSGDNGTILRSTNNGATWTPFVTGTTEAFNGSSFSSPTNGFACGTNGTMQIFNGVSWTPQVSGTPNHLNNVFALSSGDAFAAGDNQTILYYNGAWSAQTCPLSMDVKDIRFTTLVDGYAAGTNGNILKTTNGGATWVPTLTGVNIDFYSIEAVGPDSAWATGFNGIVYTTTDNAVTWVRYSVGYTSTQDELRVTGGKGHVVGQGGDGRNFHVPKNFSTGKLNGHSFDNFSVFPNPAKDNFTISALLSKPEKLIIEIKDVQGKLIEKVINSNSSNEFSAKVNTDNYKEGIYFIHIRMGERSWVQKVAVIR